MRIRALTLILVLLGMIGLVGCGQGAIFRGSSGGSSPTPTPTPTPTPNPTPTPTPTATLVSISITPVGPAVTIGGSYQLKAIGTFSDQSTQDLSSSATWSVDQSTIATVSAGRVTGKAVGVAFITATYGKISSSTPVNVTRLSAGPGTLTGSYAFFLTTIDSRGQAVVAGSFTVDGAGSYHIRGRHRLQHGARGEQYGTSEHNCQHVHGVAGRAWRGGYKIQLPNLPRCFRPHRLCLWICHQGQDDLVRQQEMLSEILRLPNTWGRPETRTPTIITYSSSMASTQTIRPRRKSGCSTPAQVWEAQVQGSTMSMTTARLMGRKVLVVH